MASDFFKYFFLTTILLVSSDIVLGDEVISGNRIIRDNIDGKGYIVRGEIIDKITREPLAAAVISVWNSKIYAVADSKGEFILPQMPGGVYRLKVNLLGYKEYLSYEIMLSLKGEYITIELEEESLKLNEITVKPKADPFKRVKESPLSQKNIGIQEIERNPGSNRDISKVLNTFPGVANVTGSGERNDILVRGGAPSENRFYLDGIEIPTINHFSTQGSSGGVVGIIDANFVRDADFYAGSFPVNKANALSSVLDIRLKDGDPVKNRYKFTVGASEAGVSANGHLTDKTSFLFSARTSYLQFLFKALKLPFLPTFTDAQFKIKTRFDNKHELTIIGLGALDNMSLNEDTGGIEENEYILSYLPVIQQEVFTIGAIYRYYGKLGYTNIVLSQSYLKNRNTKYLGNDESNEENLTLKYSSVESETKLRAEKILTVKEFRIVGGVSLELPSYSNSTYQKIFYENPVTINYNTNLNLIKYGLFASGNYTTSNNKLSATFAIRGDGNDFNKDMSNIFKTLSPRLSISYAIDKQLNISASAGRYFQLPPFTTMGYRDQAGYLANKDLKYIGADHLVAGIEYKPDQNTQFTLEGFYKKYFGMPLSIADNIPVLGKGSVYGIVGNEDSESSLSGKSYGVEFAARVFVSDKFNLIGTSTLFRSLFLSSDNNKWISQTWDNGFLLTLSSGYKLPKNYYIGIKYRYAGGTPYTPYDAAKSSLVQAWNASGRPYLDYSSYNSLKLPAFNQLDLRIDKEFYWNKAAFKLYIDIQNILNNKYINPDILLSTGTISNPSAQLSDQTYIMKYIKSSSGTILPTIGLSLEF